MKKLIIGIGVVAIIAGVTLVSLKKEKTSSSFLKTVTTTSTNDNSGRFEKLLAYVPKDTSYLFGNKNALPEDYVNKQLNKAEKLIKAFENIFADKNIDKNSSKDINFIANYYKQFTKLYKENNLKSMGFEKGQRAIIYGYNSYPVLRAEIIDSKAFINSIDSIAKESNTSIKWESCGQFQCIKSKDSDIMTTFLVKEKSIVLSFYSKEIKDDMFKHMTQTTPIKDSYSMENFDKLLSQNSFKGFGDGFIDLELIANRLISTIKEEASPNEKASFDSCSPIAQDIAKKVNKIYLGITQLSTKNTNMSIIFDMDSNITKSLQGITNKNLFTQRVANPMFDLGFNLNAQGLSNAIMELSNYLATQGQKHGCKEIDAQALRQSSAMASMSIAMAIGQLSELYFSINDLEMDKSGMPTKIGVNAQISAPNPASLIGMLQMLSPQLAKLNIPTTGEEVDLLKALPQPIPPFITELKASIKDKIISLRLGEKPKMEQFKPKEHTILWAKVNNKKYYELLSMMMKKNRQNMSALGSRGKAEYDAMLKGFAKNDEKAEELMKVIYDSNTISTQNIYVNDRGLVIEFGQENREK